MYKYSYVKIKSKLDNWGVFDGNIYTTEDFHLAIVQKANDGWRYVGYIPTRQRGTGHIEEFELIFEKEV